MFFSTLLTASALVAGSLASPLVHPHVVHEKRSSNSPGWTRRDALDRRAILPMRIALAQGNLDKGHDWLMVLPPIVPYRMSEKLTLRQDVSHPESEKYGQHWTAKDVAQAFAPRYL